jgi:hypothetical protein
LFPPPPWPPSFESAYFSTPSFYSDRSEIDSENGVQRGKKRKKRKEKKVKGKERDMKRRDWKGDKWMERWNDGAIGTDSVIPRRGTEKRRTKRIVRGRGKGTKCKEEFPIVRTTMFIKLSIFNASAIRGDDDESREIRS